MKFPRWLVILMLSSSVLAVLVTAGWWWVTWPERTARAFANLICEGEFESARKMIKWKPDANVTIIMVNDRLRREWVDSNLKSEPRTLGEFVAGRQRFQITGQPVRYVVERGTVTECGVSVMTDEEIVDFYRTVRETEPVVRKLLNQ